MVDLRKKIIRKLTRERTEKYYQCPQCQELITETEILDECSQGSCGMCYCEFNNGRILNKYKRISKKKYFELNSLKNVQLVTKKQHGGK